jgi:hypothetical protein
MANAAMMVDYICRHNRMSKNIRFAVSAKWIKKRNWEIARSIRYHCLDGARLG